jgi:hypothetical protein
MGGEGQERRPDRSQRDAVALWMAQWTSTVYREEGALRETRVSYADAERRVVGG